MNRTRQKKQEATAEATAEAQDYVWGWRDVPEPVRLDFVCKYLDAASMGILEICGKSCLGNAQRAWHAKAAGVARGSLAIVSTKKLVAAQARVDALLPHRVDALFTHMRVWAPYREPVVNFDEFAFSLTVMWMDEDETTLRASFPFMRMTDNTSEMGDHGGYSTHMFFVSPEAPGQDLLAPLLRSEEESQEWRPSAYLTCTRQTDGATVRMAHFHGIEFMSWHNPDPNTGQLSLAGGRLLVAGAEDRQREGAKATFHFRWDVGTGRLLAFCSTYSYMDREVEGFELYSRLHARLDESVRD